MTAAVATIIHKDLTIQLPAEATLVIGDGVGETTITARRSPLVSVAEAPRLALSQRLDTALPALGEPFGGGFFAGRHPTVEGAVLVVAGIDGEGRSLTWEKAVAHCLAYGGGDVVGWKAPDRIESLVLWERLGAPVTSAEAFKKGGPQAFAEEAYWTDQESQFHSADAWLQGFGGGGSGGWSKNYDLRVRPVRIVLI